jgi:membrane protease YdiL (CAAX protease family)
VRCAVVLATTAFIVGYTFWFSGVLRWPIRESAAHFLTALSPSLGSGLTNIMLFVIVPGAIVTVLGARASELGLGRPAVGTSSAAAWILAPFAFAGAARAIAISLPMPIIAVVVLRNAMSNGFSEEFFFRGLWFAHARAVMRTDWALLIQAIAFALLHVGTSLHDEPNALGIVANIIALNLPMGYLLGLIVLRTQSLWLPAAIHTAIDASRNLLGMYAP